ncbi:hypothetical protein ACLB2K_007600 [Fragaria x ananassa]
MPVPKGRHSRTSRRLRQSSMRAKLTDLCHDSTAALVDLVAAVCSGSLYGRQRGRSGELDRGERRTPRPTTSSSHC